MGKLKTTPRRRSERDPARPASASIFWTIFPSASRRPVHHRRGALRLFAFNRLKSHLLPVPYAILSDALPHSPSHQVGGSRRLFQPRRVVRRQTASARETHDVISDAFANNARSLRFAIVIYGAIRPLSSARLGVYCICRRRCIVRRDDNAIRDADAR